jgi:signal peptidase I
MSWLTEIVVLVIVAFVIALTMKTYLVQPFKIPSGSMEDTLLVNDKVLVNKLVGHLSQIHRGDVVVFRCCDAQGRLTVNGVPLQESGYLYPGSAPSAIRFSILVPPGRLWVMGDHREDSSDSEPTTAWCGVPNASPGIATGPSPRARLSAGPSWWSGR